MTFSKWLDTFLKEKGIDLETTFNVEGPVWGWNLIPLGNVVEAIKGAPKHEQAQIKTMIVKIDFANAPVIPFFEHLAQAIAI